MDRKGRVWQMYLVMISNPPASGSFLDAAEFLVREFEARFSQ